jgi:hypothetical protein
VSATILPIPMRWMRGQANSQLRDTVDIYRNDGYGWEHVSRCRGTVHHLLTPPAPGDPVDSSAALSQLATIDIPRHIASRIGDECRVRGKRWIVGDGNFDESYASLLHLSVARPTAATPRTWINIRRFNISTGLWTILAPQLVQISWSRNQPDRLGGVAIRQFGWVFSPEEITDPLDIEQGDTFYYDGRTHSVQWVPADSAGRREAIFWTNVGEGV